MNGLFKLFSRFHARVLKKSGGTKMNSMSGTDVFVLNTIGAKSGKQRHTALVYRKEGNDYYLIASAGGQDNHPGWYHNMVAHPDKMSIDVNGEHHEVTMSELSGDEREQMWEKFIEMFEEFGKYRNATNRDIPVIKLTPKS